VGQTIASLDPKWDRPYIALLDGKPILRRDWNLYVENGRILVFIDVEAVPADTGGGGSNPVRMIAMLAVIAISAGVAGAVAGMGAFALNGAGVAGTVLGMGGAIAGGAVMLVGSAIVNAVLPTTPQQMSNRQMDTRAASPTYSLQAQGNAASNEQPTLSSTVFTSGHAPQNNAAKTTMKPTQKTTELIRSALVRSSLAMIVFIPLNFRNLSQRSMKKP
jgi:hypothetical protein